jgi:hypothetical protein
MFDSDGFFAEEISVAIKDCNVAPSAVNYKTGSGLEDSSRDWWCCDGFGRRVATYHFQGITGVLVL